MTYTKLMLAFVALVFFQICFANAALDTTSAKSGLVSFITNPHSAYIFMLVAIYGLFFEIANPGFILPGILGLAALLMALYAFQLLPIDYNALTLMLIGIVLMMLETFIPSYGASGIVGVIAFICGSVMLFDMHYPESKLILPVIIAMSLLTTTFFLILHRLMRRTHNNTSH